MSLPITIAQLRERISTATAPASRGGVELVGVTIRLGAIHEWFGVDDGAHRWSPPLCVFADLARKALAQRAASRVFWIGRRVWPYPLLCDQHREVLWRSVLVDPPDHPSRLWAIDVALRTATPVAVMADAQDLTLPHTRRLQLAAASAGALCLLARPPWELDRLSAATTRWGVTHARSLTIRPRWTVALLRNKDRPVLTEEPPSWTVEWNHAQGLVRVPAAVADRAHRPAAQAS